MHCCCFGKRSKKELTRGHPPPPPSTFITTPSSVTVKRSHTLEIRRFSFTKSTKGSNYISSDPFLIAGYYWKLLFFSNGDININGEEYVSFKISLVGKAHHLQQDVQAYFEFALMDHFLMNKWYKQVIGPVSLNHINMFWGCSHFCTRSELEESRFMQQDCFNIRCTVNVVISIPKQTKWLETMEGSDISFEVEGQIFYGNKLLLSSHSPVFKAQFFGPLKEENNRLIKIEEMGAPIFKALLDYTHDDVLPVYESKYVATIMAQQLLVAADRYRMERLISVCEAILCVNIEVKTVVSNLSLAEHYGCLQLKWMCIEFIGRSPNFYVTETNEFKNLKEWCPAVIDEVLKSVELARDHSCVTFTFGR